jgi:hypothetical protein
MLHKTVEYLATMKRREIFWFPMCLLKMCRTRCLSLLFSTWKEYVRFEVFRPVTMKNVVFWDMAPCRSYVNRCFGGSSLYSWVFSTGCSVCSHLLTLVHCPGFFYPEDGDDTFLRNVGSHKIYTVPHPRRRHSSCKEYVPPKCC